MEFKTRYADPNHRTVDQLNLDHKDCKFSSGLDDLMTAGQGYLDPHGKWEIPCYECAKKMQDKIDGV